MVWLAAVVTHGNVPDADDPVIGAGARVRAVLVAPDPTEDAEHGGGVVTQQVGRPGHVEPVPGERGSR